VVEVDDRRVHCGSCDSRVDLDGSTPYSLSGWESHLLQCGSNGIPTIGYVYYFLRDPSVVTLDVLAEHSKEEVKMTMKQVLWNKL